MGFARASACRPCFLLFLNEIEESFIQSGLEGLDIDTFKLFLLLYADDIVILANSSEQLQESLNILSYYCSRWKLTVNVAKVMFFRKGGILPRNLAFYYNCQQLKL